MKWTESNSWLRGYSHDRYRNDFHSGTSSFHLLIFFYSVYMIPKRHFVPVRVIRKLDHSGFFIRIKFSFWYEIFFWYHVNWNRKSSLNRIVWGEVAHAYLIWRENHASETWARTPKGWFPLPRNFYVRTCVKFTFANKMKAMHERSLESVKVEPRSTSRLSSALQFYLSSILFTWLKFTCFNVRSQTRVSGNQPLGWAVRFQHVNAVWTSLCQRNSFRSESHSGII